MIHRPHQSLLQSKSIPPSSSVDLSDHHVLQRCAPHPHHLPALPPNSLTMEFYPPQPDGTRPDQQYPLPQETTLDATDVVPRIQHQSISRPRSEPRKTQSPTNCRAIRHQRLYKEIAEMEQELDEQISIADPYERVSFQLHIEVSLLGVYRQQLREGLSELRGLIGFVQEGLTDAQKAHTQWQAAMKALRKEIIDLKARSLEQASNSIIVCELGAVAARMVLENYVAGMDEVAEALVAFFELRDSMPRSEFSLSSETSPLTTSDVEVVEETRESHENAE